MLFRCRTESEVDEWGKNGFNELDRISGPDYTEAGSEERWDHIRELLGGKGANLAEMTRIGVPVPSGFVVGTHACKAFLASDERFPEGMWQQVLDALKAVEKQTHKAFGSRTNPLLVSCRSGAKFSMPGMMDTVLNIGLNDETAAAMVELTGDAHFVFDAYRRLVQMFGGVVMGIKDEVFEAVLTRARESASAYSDTQLRAEDWQAVTTEFKNLFKKHIGQAFPDDPLKQLEMATAAVFKSWNGKRAVDYRNAADIPHDLGTAVNIVSVVFGNMGEDCATGVALTRNGTTGENRMEGDFLTNAQGEDVVAGIRNTLDIHELKAIMPQAFLELTQVAQKLEKHYRDMQDIEFTIEKGKLWMLQTRNGKRTAQAAVRIVVEMAQAGLINRKEALIRITPEQVDFFLHPQFDPKRIADAKAEGKHLAVGLNVSPGAACGVVAFDADLAQKWTEEEGKAVIMVRVATKPDDVHGMLASRGILTSRGGRTSHAALVARQFGKPAVVGVSELDIDLTNRKMHINAMTIEEGGQISIDGTSGDVYAGIIDTITPDIKDPFLLKLLSWADTYRKLGVWANADYPQDAKRARDYGAEGIGLCRTEHMFFEANRLPLVREMILSDDPEVKRRALDALQPFQREDFMGLFRVMDGLPVIIRLIDPPQHEFLPDQIELVRALSDLKIRHQQERVEEARSNLSQEIHKTERMLRRVEALSEMNPMLGLRGVRLGIHFPEITIMQVRAIFEAACQVSKEGIDVHPKIMIPLTSHVNELKIQRKVLETEGREIMRTQGVDIDYKFGTMIEVPRAALTADEIADYAAFFSFGTNDLTQTTFGISRDDAEAGFLIEYMQKGILPENPFTTIDRNGVVAFDADCR